MNLPLQELCVVILFDWFHAPLRCLSQNVRCFKVSVKVVSASIIASIFEGRHKSQGSKNQTSKKESVYLLFSIDLPMTTSSPFSEPDNFLRFIAIACYCPCASQQRIDEIYDFLAENASRPPIGPLPKFHPTRPFDQSVTKEADEGAHGPGNQAQLEMKICSKWRSVKILSTLAWHSELPPKVEFVFHPSFLQ